MDAHRQVRDRPLGAALRRERRGAHRFRGGDGARSPPGTTGAAPGRTRPRVHEAMGREALASEEVHQRGRASAARRRLLPLRQIPVRARRAADEGRAHEGGRVPQRSRCRISIRRASASTIPYEGKALYGILRKPTGVDEAAGADHGGRPRLRQGRNRRLRAAVISIAASRRWCSTGPGRARANTISRSAATTRSPVKAVVDYVETRARSRYVAHRPVGRQPRRLLRAARRGVREAHQGLHRARRPVRLGRSTGTACRN